MLFLCMYACVQVYVPVCTYICTNTCQMYMSDILFYATDVHCNVHSIFLSLKKMYTQKSAHKNFF